MYANKDIKKEWIKAFFDDEAYVSKKQKRIVLNVVNLGGLKQIQKLLNEFGIISTLNGPYYYKQFFSYHLNIYRPQLRKYSEQIGFYHPKKKKDLATILNGDAGI